MPASWQHSRLRPRFLLHRHHHVTQLHFAFGLWKHNASKQRSTSAAMHACVTACNRLPTRSITDHPSRTHNNTSAEVCSISRPCTASTTGGLFTTHQRRRCSSPRQHTNTCAYTHPTAQQHHSYLSSAAAPHDCAPACHVPHLLLCFHRLVCLGVNPVKPGQTWSTPCTYCLPDPGSNATELGQTWSTARASLLNCSAMVEGFCTRPWRSAADMPLPLLEIMLTLLR